MRRKLVLLWKTKCSHLSDNLPNNWKSHIVKFIRTKTVILESEIGKIILFNLHENCFDMIPRTVS